MTRDPRDLGQRLDDKYVFLDQHHFQGLDLPSNFSANSMPAWTGLQHFKQITAVEFTTGDMWRDLSWVNITNCIELENADHF